jgi:hypothetical protein
MGNTEPRRMRRLLHKLTIVVDDSHGHFSFGHPQICDGEVFLAIASPILSQILAREILGYLPSQTHLEYPAAARIPSQAQPSFQSIRRSVNLPILLIPFRPSSSRRRRVIDRTPKFLASFFVCFLSAVITAGSAPAQATAGLEAFAESSVEVCQESDEHEA